MNRKFVSPKILLLTAVLATSLLSASRSDAATYLIHVGPTLTNTSGWNNLQFQNTSISLFDTTGSSLAGISLANTGFSNVGTTGPDNMTGAALAAFGASTNVSNNFFATSTTATGVAYLTFSGLSPASTYTLTVYGGRGNTASPVSDDRTGSYLLTGSTSQTLTLNAAMNSSNIITFNAMTPNANGTLVLDVSRFTGNTQFAYVNALKLDSVTAVPEPSTAYIMLGAVALVAFRVIRRRRLS